MKVDSLPAGLTNTGKIPVQSQLAELDTRHAEILYNTTAISALYTAVLDLSWASIMGHSMELHLRFHSGFHGQSGVLSQVLKGFTVHLILSIHIPLEVIADDVCRVLRSTGERNLV